MDLTTPNAFKLYVGLASLSFISEPYMAFDGEDDRVFEGRGCQGPCSNTDVQEYYPGPIKLIQLVEPAGLNKRINILNKRVGLPERWVPMYAIVREDVELKSFGKWHQTEAEAMEEASRLCRKERKSFIIIKAIKRVTVPDVPVHVEEIKGGEYV